MAYLARTRHSGQAVRHQLRGSGGDPAVQGGFAGVLLHFANGITRAVEDEFPDRKIGMFLYESSLLAPRNAEKVHRNLVAMAKKLEMTYIESRETLEDFRQRVSSKIGQEVPWPPTP